MGSHMWLLSNNYVIDFGLYYDKFWLATIVIDWCVVVCHFVSLSFRLYCVILDCHLDFIVSRILWWSMFILWSIMKWLYYRCNIKFLVCDYEWLYRVALLACHFLFSFLFLNVSIKKRTQGEFDSINQFNDRIWSF